LDTLEESLVVVCACEWADGVVGWERGGDTRGDKRWGEETGMVKVLLFCVLFVWCWPVALVALVLYPFMWLVLLPFRIVGIAVEGVLELVGAVITLPVRVLRRV